MNQILVTEKIYVTPELKRKKKIYKILFIISIIMIVALFSFYIYSEYDKNRQEGISGDILSFLASKEDDTMVGATENDLVVKITQEVAQETEELEQENTSNDNNKKQLQMATATSEYVASNGKKYEAIGIVKIPKINISYPILAQTTNVDVMKVSPYKFWGANPNEVGNLCIIGHNYRRKGVFFSDVPSLQVGDIVEIQDLSQRTIQYEVYDLHTVDPNDRSDTTQYTNGKKEVTLITCTDDAKQRVIVKCTEKK